MLKDRGAILEGLESIGFLGAKAEAQPVDKLLQATLLIPNHLHFLEPI